MKENKENRARVVRLAMKNPTMSVRDMAKKLNVPAGSVWRYLREYRESDDKDPRVVSITSKDLDIVRRGQEIIEAKLSNEEEVARMTAAQVSAVTSESAKRYSLLKGVQNNEQGNVNNQAIQVNILFGDNNQWETP